MATDSSLSALETARRGQRQGITLPSIHTLDVLGPWSRPQSAYPLSAERTQPRGDVFSGRFARAEEPDKSLSAFNIFQDPFKPRNSKPAHSLPLGVTFSVLEPRILPERQDVYENYSLRRKASSESLSSTPSLSNSFCSNYSTSNGPSPALRPTTPQYYIPSAYAWELNNSKSEAARDVTIHCDSRLSSPLLTRASILPPAARRAPAAQRTKSISSISPLSPPISPSFSSIPRGSLQPSSKIEKSKPRKKCRASPKFQEGTSKCNVKYLPEQSFFIIYHWADLNMEWKEIKRRYAARFGELPRTEGGVQSQMYRLNDVCPVTTGEDKLLVFGLNPPEKTDGEEHNQEDEEERKKEIMKEDTEHPDTVDETNKTKKNVLPFNEYDNKVYSAKARDTGKVKLADRYAEQVVEMEAKLDWIRPDDLAEARRLAAIRRPYRLAWETEGRKQALLAQQRALNPSRSLP